MAETTYSPEPLPHPDGGTLAHVGRNLEFVHQAACAGQAHSQAPARAVSFLKRSCDIRDSWSVVPSDNQQAAPRAVHRRRDHYLATESILDDVARDFGHSRGDEHEVAAGKADLRCH